MDEIANDLSALRAQWSGATATTAKAKAKRRAVEKSISRSSEYWTGRSAQLNVRMTPELKTAVQNAATEFGMSMADFFEAAMVAYIEKKRAKP